MSKRIVLSTLASQNIGEISKFIEEDSSFRAKKFILEIKKKIFDLILFPKLGKQIDNERYIYLIHKNYFIIYKIEKDIIYVISVKNVKNKVK